MPCFSLFQGLETYGSLVETPFLSASRDYFQLLEVYMYIYIYHYAYLHAYDSVFIHHKKKKHRISTNQQNKKTPNSFGSVG